MTLNRLLSPRGPSSASQQAPIVQDTPVRALNSCLISAGEGPLQGNVLARTQDVSAITLQQQQTCTFLEMYAATEYGLREELPSDSLRSRNGVLFDYLRKLGLHGLAQAVPFQPCPLLNFPATFLRFLAIFLTFSASNCIGEWSGNK
jgi:hypothetical protein